MRRGRRFPALPKSFNVPFSAYRAYVSLAGKTSISGSACITSFGKLGEAARCSADHICFKTERVWERLGLFASDPNPMPSENESARRGREAGEGKGPQMPRSLGYLLLLLLPSPAPLSREWGHCWGWKQPQERGG